MEWKESVLKGQNKNALFLIYLKNPLYMYSFLLKFKVSNCTFVRMFKKAEGCTHNVEIKYETT